MEPPDQWQIMERTSKLKTDLFKVSDGGPRATLGATKEL
jgi:hypothetical protein